MAQEWNRVALAVARKTGQTVGLNASTRTAMDAKPVAQFRIQFFGVPTDRAPTILGEVDLLNERLALFCACPARQPQETNL
jgi:hypothetical protein